MIAWLSKNTKNKMKSFQQSFGAHYRDYEREFQLP